MVAFCVLWIALAGLTWLLLETLSPWTPLATIKHLLSFPNCAAAERLALRPLERISRATGQNTTPTITESPASRYGNGGNCSWSSYKNLIAKTFSALRWYLMQSTSGKAISHGNP